MRLERKERSYGLHNISISPDPPTSSVKKVTQRIAKFHCSLKQYFRSVSFRFGGDNDDLTRNGM